MANSEAVKKRHLRFPPHFVVRLRTLLINAGKLTEDIIQRGGVIQKVREATKQGKCFICGGSAVDIFLCVEHSDAHLLEMYHAHVEMHDFDLTNDPPQGGEAEDIMKILGNYADIRNTLTEDKFAYIDIKKVGKPDTTGCSSFIKEKIEAMYAALQ